MGALRGEEAAARRGLRCGRRFRRDHRVRRTRRRARRRFPLHLSGLEARSRTLVTSRRMRKTSSASMPLGATLERGLRLAAWMIPKGTSGKRSPRTAGRGWSTAAPLALPATRPTTPMPLPPPPPVARRPSPRPLLQPRLLLQERSRSCHHRRRTTLSPSTQQAGGP